MGDQDAGEGFFVLHFQHRLPKVLPGEGVQRPEGFVQDQHFRFVDERTAERGALSHTAGQFRGAFVLETLQTHQFQEMPCARLLFGGGHGSADDLQGKHDVLEDRPPFQKNRILERHAHGRAWAFHALAMEPDLALVRLHQPCDQARQGRLSAARGADDGDETAFGHGDVQVVQHWKRSAGGLVGMAYRFDLYEISAHGRLPDNGKGKDRGARPPGCSARRRADDQFILKPPSGR